MNPNRGIAATITFLAVIALALGTFFALGGGTDEPPAADSPTADPDDDREATSPVSGDDGDDPAAPHVDDRRDPDVLIGAGSGAGNGNELLVDPQPGPPGMSRICITVEHQPVAAQGAASGIWVRGEVYGLDGGWIWVQGPTMNGGDPIQLPVADGTFEGPLGIDSYGEHTLERFELVPDADAVDPLDLLPTLDSGPGRLVTVTGAEGPAFDSECFDLEPPTAEEDTAPPVDDPALDPDTTVQEFLDGFIADHTAGDVQGLLDTLHPAIPLAFGETTCVDYVGRTTGSLAGAELRSVGALTDLDLDSPAGPITIADVLPFDVELTLTDGSTMTSEANLALLEGEPHWLTRCGH